MTSAWADNAVISWNMGKDGATATGANAITGASGCAAEGFTIAITGNESKAWSAGNGKFTLDGVEYTSLKNSKDAQNTITCPTGYKATHVKFIVVTNDDKTASSLTEFDGTTCSDAVSSLKDYTNPTVIEKDIDNKESFTFTFSTKQVCFIAIVTYTKPATKKTVNFINDAGWDNVFVWSWNSTTGENFTGGNWPGVELNKAEDNTYPWQTTGDPDKIIFHNNAGTQTDDLEFKDGGIYNSKGRVINLNDYTVTFTTDGMEEVYAYTWSGNGESKVEQLGAWPGTKMDVAGRAYSITIKAEAAPEHIIFNNGNNGIQTPDLDFEDGKAYEYFLQNFILSFTTDAGWNPTYVYMWTGDKIYTDAWPGTQMDGETYEFRAFEAPANIQFNNGKDKTTDMKFVNGKAYQWITAEPLYKLNVDDAFTAGQSVDVQDAENDVVATITYGTTGNAFKAAVAAPVDGWAGFVAMTAGNETNGDADGGTTYTIVPKYDGNITVAVRLNGGKKFYVLEDGTALSNYNGITISEAANTTFSFAVSANKSYKLYCAGSKLGFFGFDYKFKKPEPQPVANTTINFFPGVWSQSEQEASYAAWAWGAAGEPGAWYAFDTEQRAFTIPETCAKIIIVRYNPEIQLEQLTFDNIWNRTDELTITAGKMYEITAWGADGSNSTCVVKAWPPVFFEVNVAENIQNGQVSVIPNSAEEGSTVTVTATPDEGYVLDDITVTCDNSNQAVPVAEDGTFTMPADNVTVNATFKEPSIVSYYVVGNMTKWQIENTFQLLPSKTEEGLYEYYGTFAANDEIKVLDDKGTWYPAGNNYVFAEAGDYVVSFRPAGNIEGWFGGYFNVAKQGGDDPQPTGKSFTIKFKDNGVGNGDGNDAKTAIADLIADGADYVKATDADKAYNGKEGYGVKLSSSKANGYMTLTLAQSVKPTKITFKASAWVNSSGVADAASISINSKAAQELTDELAEYAVDYDGETEVSEIAIAATKRAYISEVTVFYGDGGGDTPEPSLVSKVQICGATDAEWKNRIDFVLNSAAPEQPNVYYNTLDATDYTDDVEFKLVINGEIWKGIGEITLLDNDGLVDVTTNADGSKNFILKNSNLKYKTYNFKALWKGKEDAGSNWELEVFGQDLRSETPQPAEPVFIVVGQPQSIFGGTKEWDTENDAHKLEEKSGKYYCTFTNVAPQEQNIELKVYNMANEAWFGKTVDGGENIVFNMKETGDFTVVLDLASLDYTKGYIWVEGDNVVFPETPDPQPTGETSTTTFDFTSSTFISGLGLAVPADSKTTAIESAITSDNVTLTPIKCSSNWPSIYNSSGALSLRIYALKNDIKGGVQFSVADGTVDKVVMTGSTQLQYLTADNGTISMSADNKTLTWTKAESESPASVTFYNEGSKTVPINTIDVTKTIVGGGDTPAVDTYGIVGDLTGGWEKDLMMTVSPNDANIYTATVEGVDIPELKGYEYKLRANKSWQGYQIPTEGNQTWKPEAVGVYTFTFTANIAENTLTVDAQKTADLEIIANTPETALTVADAIALIDNTDATVLAKDYNKVYIKGTATEIGKVNEKYLSLTYYLTDGENKIQIYSGKYLNGADFDQDKADALKDKVVTVYGNLKLFNGTPEVDMNSIIYSIEGEEPVADTWTVAGSAQALFGTAWDPANTANDMQLVEGLYTWQMTDVAIPANTVVEFKVVKNHAWSEAYPAQNYLLTITEQGTYTITITFDAVSHAVNAVATKTGEAELPDATIDVVNLLGDWNGWKTMDEAGMPALPIMTKGEGNVWTGVLDLSAVTADQQFKFVVNKDTWIGCESDMVINAPEGWVVGLPEVDNNFLLKNATTGYQTYDITATWQANPNAAAGWTLTIAGKDERVAPQPQLNDYSVQFVNLQGFENVHAYTWGNGEPQQGEWPGAAMTLINEQASFGGQYYPIYQLDFKAETAPEFIIFNNGQGGNGNQTEDLAFENGKRYIVLDMKGTTIATVKEPMELDYSDKVKFYNGMPTIVWGELSETETAKFKVGDAIHIRIVDCKGMRSPALQLMSNDGKVELTERLATDITEVPAIVTIPVTGALYEWMKDEQHKVRLCGQNIWIDKMTVEEGAYEEAATTTEENTISVWVPESEEGDEITEEKTVEIPATSFIVSDVKEEEVVKIKASAVEPNPIIAKRRALAATDISIMKKGSSDVKLVDDANIRVSEDGSGYEFTVTDELATTLKTEGFEIKNKTAKNIKVKAVEVQKLPAPKYYLVGTMNGWAIEAQNELTPNKVVDGEFMITLDLAADDEIKVVMSTDESTVTTWYPEGMDNNYKITESGNYSIFFRPDGQGGDSWYYGYFFVQLNEGTGIKSVKNAAALKGAQIYTISGQRVDKAQKGLYIVNGKKVFIK